MATYRAIDRYTSEMMVQESGLGAGPPYVLRLVVSRDGMTLTEVRKTLNDRGETTGETTLVYDRISP